MLEKERRVFATDSQGTADPIKDQPRAIRQAAEGFCNEKGRYLEALRKAERAGPWPENFNFPRHSIPWPVHMSNPKVHITGFFGEPHFAAPTDKNMHKAVDIQLALGLPVRAPENVGLAGCMEDRFREGMSDVFLYAPGSRILYAFSHLDTSSLSSETKKTPGWDMWHYDSRIVSAGTMVGTAAEFMELSRDISVDPDVGEEYGRTYNHVHIETYFVPDPDRVHAVPGWQKGGIYSINPLLVFRQLYSPDK